MTPDEQRAIEPLLKQVRELRSLGNDISIVRAIQAEAYERGRANGVGNRAAIYRHGMENAMQIAEDTQRKLWQVDSREAEATRWIVRSINQALQNNPFVAEPIVVPAPDPADGNPPA